MSSAKAIAIIAGAGPGTGACVAARFAKLYTVVLLARSAPTLSSLVEKITKAGGEALAIPTDVSDQKSVHEAFRKIKETYPGQEVRVGVYNVAGRPKVQSFLDMTTEEWAAGFEAPNRGAFNFSQSIIPLLLASSKSSNTTASSDSDIRYPPTLIFTGATASVKASAKFSGFTPGKFALRSLSQSIAKEFGPQGVHISHAVIDGVIDTEFTKEWMVGAGPDAKINPEAIADEYWHLHTQSRSAWSWEIEIRPYIEKW